MIRISSVLILCLCAAITFAVAERDPEFRPPVVFPPPVPMVDVEIEGEVTFYPTVKEMEPGTSGWIESHDFLPHSKQVTPGAEVYDEPKGSFDLRFRIQKLEDGKYKLYIPKGHKFSRRKIYAA